MKTLAFVVSLPVLAGGAHAQSPRTQIDALNARIVKLMMAKDVKGLTKAMKAGLTPDFKYVEGGRTQTRDAMCANMAMGIGQMQTMAKADAKTIALREKGDEAIAITLHTMKGTTMGADHKPHTLLFTGTSSDTYVKQGGKWRMSRMTWVKQTTTLDGRPLGG